MLERRQMETIKLSGGRIFVLTSGMMTANTAAYEMALRMIEDERHAIFFVGYADPETPGGRLKASAVGRPFHYSTVHGEVTRRCEVSEFDLTTHANREDLLDFVGVAKPRVVVLGHGDPASRTWFETAIRQRHPRIKILQPGPGETIEV